MSKQQKNNKVVQPIIKVDGEDHLLEKLFEGDPKNLPTLVSVGYGRLKDGNHWVSYVITTRGKEVISVEVDEPNLRSIAEESAKTSFVTKLMDQWV